MERRHRRSYGLTDLDKRLEMKINEHKMLMNTLHEAFRRPSATEYTLNTIKSAISDTLEEIADLREEINGGNKTSGSLFDGIEKKVEIPAKKDKPKANPVPPLTSSFFDRIQKKEKELEEKKPTLNLSSEMHVDNILFCNRFLFDIGFLGIPQTMIQWVDVNNDPQRTIEFAIYDFVDEDGVPVLAKLAAYDGRKFVAELKHLNPVGEVVYKEKFNGCYLDLSIKRDSLRYADSEPSQIILKLYYDGVSYETGC